ncbi:hypothetical protein [Microvirga sp. P5_D2]
MMRGKHLIRHRDYRIFAFLADVRNDEGVPPIAQPRDLPDDTSDGVAAGFRRCDDAHSVSWLSISELLDYDYDRIVTVEERRAAMAVHSKYRGSAVMAEEVGVMAVRELLGEDFFDELQELKTCGVERIVFWFDN